MFFNKQPFRLITSQFIKFGIIGVSNTLISLAIYYLLVWLGIHYLTAQGVGFAVSVCNAYYWNNRYVFSKTQKGNIKPFIKTVAVYGFTFLLSLGILFVTIDILNISKWIAPLISLCVTVPLNFLLNKYWAFK